MTLTVRLPHRVEQELAEYCVKRKLTKSQVVKQALDGLLSEPAGNSHGARHPFIGGDQGDGADVSGNVKAALRARFRAAGSSGKRGR